MSINGRVVRENSVRWPGYALRKPLGLMGGQAGLNSAHGQWKIGKGFLIFKYFSKF
jgi:hypothetical protein